MNQINATDAGGRPLGIGQIGAGEMARTRAQAFMKRPDVRVALGWSRSPDTIDAYRKLTGAAVTDSWRQVIGDPRVDAVCVGTPTATHADIAVAAAQAGKHVLVECPAASNMADLDRMAAAAECAGVVFYIASNYRFDRNAQAVAHAAANLGRIRLAQGDSSWQPKAGSWFWDNDLSGGAFVCVHLYQFALFHCLGPAVSIDAAFADNPHYGVARVKYACGAIGVATGGFYRNGINKFVVVGSEGVMQQAPDGRFVLNRGSDTVTVPIDSENPTERDNAAFIRCIRGQDDWRTYWRMERDIIALSFAAQQSAEGDCRITLPS